MRSISALVCSQLVWRGRVGVVEGGVDAAGDVVVGGGGLGGGGEG